MRAILIVLLVACGSHRDAPNTVTGTLTIGGAAVTATCDLEPWGEHVALILATAKGRVRVAEHHLDNGSPTNDYDVSLDGKSVKCKGVTVTGTSGHDEAVGQGTSLWWKGRVQLDCADLTGDLSLDCGR